MKTLIVMCALVSVGCLSSPPRTAEEQKKFDAEYVKDSFPILHPKTGPGTDYPCGLHLDPYKVVRDGKTTIVCCPEGHSPWLSQPGYCAAK